MKNLTDFYGCYITRLNNIVQMIYQKSVESFLVVFRRRIGLHEREAVSFTGMTEDFVLQTK